MKNDRRKDFFLWNALKSLDLMGYDLHDLSQLSDVHLQALARNAVHGAIPEDVRRARLRALQELIWRCGRHRPRRIEDHMQCAAFVVETCRAARRECWSSVGINVDGMISRVEVRAPFVAMALRLQREFGLRRAALQIAVFPHRTDRGDHLVVARDPRRGLAPRIVPVDSPQKRSLIDAAKRLVAARGLIDLPSSVEAMLIQYLTHCHGLKLSRWRLGVEPDAICHEQLFADTLLQALPHSGSLQVDEIRSPHGRELSYDAESHDASANPIAKSMYRGFQLKRARAGADIQNSCG